MRPLFVFLTILALMAPVRVAEADDPSSGDDYVGLISAAEGDVRAVLNGAARPLEPSDPVYRGDWIETQADSRARVILNDETELNIGPGSRLRLEEFVYEPGDDSGEVLVEMGVGLLRFTTGVLKSDSYEVKTPVGSIGVRGTIFDLLVLASGASFVLLHQGLVEVQSLVASVMVQPGLYTEVSDGNAPPTQPDMPSAAQEAPFAPLAEPYASDLNRELGEHRPRLPGGVKVPRVQNEQHPKAPSITHLPNTVDVPSITRIPNGQMQKAPSIPQIPNASRGTSIPQVPNASRGTSIPQVPNAAKATTIPRMPTGPMQKAPTVQQVPNAVKAPSIPTAPTPRLRVRMGGRRP